MNLKHAVIIRIDYPEGPIFRYRLLLFRSNTLLRLQNQTDTNFEIHVRCNPAHNELFRELGCIPFNIQYNGKRNRYGVFPPWHTDLFEDYDIQTRIDCDDIVSLDFIEKIHEEYKPGRLLCFNHHVFDMWTMECVKRTRYPSNHLGMFLSLMKGKPFIYSRNHTQMWQDAEETKFIDYGYCWDVRHGQNASKKKIVRKEVSE